MDTRKQAEATDAATGAAAKRAALFASFFVPHAQAPPLHQRLESIIQELDATAPDGPHSDHDSRLEVVDLPAGHDAKVVRLILDAAGDTATAWETMDHKLRRILSAPDLPTDWWGYTIIYQGVLNESIDADAYFNQLLPAICRLYSSGDLQVLAQGDLSDGRIWLLSVPERGDGIGAATIYVALSPPDRERDLKKALLGPELLMVDLIAHKGYSLKRQYGGGAQQAYTKRREALWKTTDELMSSFGSQMPASSKRDEVTPAYNGLLGDVSKFRRMRSSTTQELHSYESWRKKIGDNDVVEYHHSRLEDAERELDVMVTQGHDALEVARTAMLMVQAPQVDDAQIDEARAEGRRRVVESVLAVAGAALAVPELVNQSAARELLSWLTVNPSYDNMFVIFLTQLAAIALVATLLVTVFLFFTGGRMRLVVLVATVVVIAGISAFPAHRHNNQVQRETIRVLLTSHYEEKMAGENYAAAFNDFSEARRARLGGLEGYAAGLDTWCKDVRADVRELEIREFEGNKATASVSVVYYTTCGNSAHEFDTKVNYAWDLVREESAWKLHSVEEEREYSDVPVEVENGGKTFSDFSGPEKENLASISTSNTAVSAQDACGNTFDYEPAKAVDNKPKTGWQVAGTGMGQWIELTYQEPVKVDRVGIIPGYDKEDPCDDTDRFYQYYVVKEARIAFSDGSTTKATFERKREMQFVDVPDVETTSLRILIDKTYPPGDKPGGPPYEVTFGKAAISEVKVEGS